MRTTLNAEDSGRISVNYLHTENLLNTTRVLDSVGPCGVLLKSELIGLLQRKHGNLPKCWSDAIAGYGRTRSKLIDVGEFRKDVVQSLAHKQAFGRLHCRGFSYQLETGMDFCDPVSTRVNLRVALMANGSLFYPTRIKRYMRRVGSNHLFLDGFPSICFALGRVDGRACHIFVMQSDLAYRGPSYIRDHFRGWRRVLFSNVIRLVWSSVDAIYLFRAEDVARACHESFPLRGNTPEVWRSIYDETARDFGMERTEFARPVNLQIYPKHRRVPCRVAYVMNVGSKRDLPRLEKGVKL